LGRFAGLKRQRGFYSNVLFGIPVALMAFVYCYGTDVGTGGSITRTLGIVLSVSLDPVVFAAVLSILFGLLPVLIIPGIGREEFDVDSEDASPRQRIVWGLAIFGVMFIAISSLCNAAFLSQTTAQLLSGWFGYHASVPAAFGITLVENILIWALTVSLLLVAIARFRSDSGSIKLISGIVIGVLVTVALCLCAVVQVQNLVLTGVLIQNGTLVPMIILVAPALVIARFLPELRALIDRMSTRMLTVVFALPGAVAAIIGFFANFPGLLRSLP
jgi:hypothetical protein